MQILCHPIHAECGKASLGEKHQRGVLVVPVPVQWYDLNRLYLLLAMMKLYDLQI
jgi:hypothetical protein